MKIQKFEVVFNSGTRPPSASLNHSPHDVCGFLSRYVKSSVNRKKSEINFICDLKEFYALYYNSLKSQIENM